jgi:hypothetical protein
MQIRENTRTVDDRAGSLNPFLELGQRFLSPGIERYSPDHNIGDRAAYSLICRQFINQPIQAS